MAIVGTYGQEPSDCCCGIDDCSEFAEGMLDTAVSVSASAVTVFTLAFCWPVTLPMALCAVVYVYCSDDETAVLAVVGFVYSCVKVFFNFITAPLAMAIELCSPPSSRIRLVSIPGAKQESVTAECFREVPEGATFALNGDKCFALHSMIRAFHERQSLTVQFRFSWWDETDFLDPTLKGKIFTSPRFQEELLFDGMGLGIENKVCFYTHVLFNILSKYRAIAQEEGTMDEYRQGFTSIMQDLHYTFTTGCVNNRLGSLTSTIADAMNLHPRLLGELGITSPIQTRFAVNLFQYQKQIARECGYTKGYYSAEAERDLLTTLGISRDGYWCNNERVEMFKRQYLPLQFFVEQLTEPADPGKLTAKFQTDMFKWYSDQGVNFETAGGVYQVNKNAVIYFLWKNDLLKEVNV